MKHVVVPILSNKETVPGVYLLWAEAPEIAALARPGQYVMVRCGEGHELTLRRPLAIHRISQDSIALLFAVVGRGTSWLSQRREGEAVDLFGPLGNGFEVHPSSKNVLLAAGGMGIAPLLALAEEALTAGREVTLLTGNKTAALVYPQHLLPHGLKPVIATDDGSLGKKGQLTDLLPEFIPGADQIFACGPISMYRTMASMPKEFVDKPVQVLLETVLGCGVGACLGCTIETRQGQRLVCKDGPVFELRDIIWEEIKEPVSSGGKMLGENATWKWGR